MPLDSDCVPPDYSDAWVQSLGYPSFLEWLNRLASFQVKVPASTPKPHGSPGSEHQG